jgi:hypothetical protein
MLRDRHEILHDILALGRGDYLRRHGHPRQLRTLKDLDYKDYRGYNSYKGYIGYAADCALRLTRRRWRRSMTL